MIKTLTTRKTVIALIGLSFVLGIWVLLVGLPWGIQSFSVFHLEKITGHNVTLEDVSLNYIDRRITFTDFELRERDSDEALITIDQFQVQFRLWPLLQKHIQLSSVVLDHPVVSVVRERDGTLNVDQLGQKNSSSSEPSGFILIVQDFQLNNGTLMYQDFTNPAHPHVRADEMSLHVSNFSTRGQEPFPIVLQGTLAENGLVVAKGRMRLSPFSLESEWDIQNARLSPYRDFLSGIPPVSGTLNSSFNVGIPPEDFSHIRVAGDVEVSDIQVGAHTSPFLTGQLLTVSDVEFSGPDHLAISKVMVRNVSLEIIRDEQGTLPVLAHFQKKNPEESPSSKTKSGITPLIGEIHIQDGSIRFIDQSTQPEYRKEFTQVMVNMKSLTSDSNQMGRITMTVSTLDEESISVEGDIRMFGDDFYLDVDGEVKKFSVSSFNPYAEKLLGWGTQSGQLTTKIHVHIEDQRLESKSKIGISDLRVVRAEADDLVNRTLGLPLDLIVDMIKNINGDIKLKVDVEGPLNKPEFSIRDAIWKSLRNAIVNIVTAPLRLIGSLVKRNSKIQKIEIDPVIFKAGTKTMTEGMEKRVVRLQKFLKKTPYIRLNIQPVISAEDLHMLRIMAVTSRIATFEKEQSLSKGPEAAQALYREKFPEKTPPDEEVALLQELVAIEPDPKERAVALASDRATIVMDRLAKTQEISANRLHIDDYGKNSTEGDAGGIEFSITR